MKTVAVIGASNDRRKFGNKAVRGYAAEGYRVIPINPHETEIEGLRSYPSILDVPDDVDAVSFYVTPTVSLTVLDDVATRGIREVWLNPGTATPDVVQRARALGIEPIVACSLVALASG